MDPVVSVLIKLRKMLHRAGKAADETDDLIQEAFLRLQTYRLSRQVHQPEAFLVRTVKNLSVDGLRQRGSRGTHVTVDSEVFQLIDPKPSPEEILSSQQRLQKLRAGLNTLGAKTREIVLLHRIEGFSHAQIAARFDITVSAVEKHIAKATLFLSDWMIEN